MNTRFRVVMEMAGAGYPVDTVSASAPWTVTYMPGTSQGVIDAGDAFLAGLDLSDAATLAWENVRLRAIASAAVGGSGSLDRMIDRAIVVQVIDRLNLIHGQFIGGAQATWDPASIANGAGLTSPGVTVTGAAFGDAVDVAAHYSLQGLVATAYVSAANTVVIRLHNSTGGAINLASGQWRVGVRRPATLAQLTYSQGFQAVRQAIADAHADGG